MWQDLIVGAVVVLAGLYALWYWMPAALRKRLGRMRPALGKAPSCGACSDCAGCATPATPSAPAPGERRAVWMASRH